MLWHRRPGWAPTARVVAFLGAWACAATAPAVGGDCLATRSGLGYADCYVTRDSLFACGFESGIELCNDPSGCDCWEVANGVWTAGIPANPPGSHSGFWAAGAALSGNYPGYSDSRLISAPIALPALGGCENLQLRFWHWFRLSSYDWGRVEIRTRRGASWGPWGGVRGADATSYSGYCLQWTSPALDISTYADSLVEIAFRFYSTRNYWGDPSEDRGWVVDDVVVLVGRHAAASTVAVESFEGGLGNWSVDRGQWEVGTPVGSPTPHHGTSCAGTVLSGNYLNGADTRLVSPAFALPALGPCETLRLRFWHWFSLSSYDTGSVEISTRRGSTWGPWAPLPTPDPTYHGYCAVWTRPSLELSAYADSTVRIGFRFASGCNYWCDPSESLGWYIDEVEILKLTEWTSLEWPDWEAFSGGLGDWAVDGGQWQVGRPTALPNAHSDSLCAGTVLAGNYSNGADTRLISPPIRLGTSARLRFYQWVQMSSYDGGYVQVSKQVPGGWSPWANLDGPFTSPNGGWALRVVPDDSLLAYAGETVRIAFYFYSRCNYWCDPSESLGWYIDDIRIQGAVTDAGDGAVPEAPRLVLRQNVPNPFNPATTIEFSVPGTTHVDVDIFDLAGRRVRRLLTTVVSGGPHRLRWDGRDEKGAPVASGVYIYRVATPAEVSSRRMVLIR